MNDQQWDKKLKIQTVGRDASQSDAYRYPYEPTDYAVLQRLADSGWISPEHVLVDYGCGKGRVGFFLHAVVGCRTIGVEYDSRVYAAALENLRSYGDAGITFVCTGAEHFRVDHADCFYFFNPFSLEVLQSVYARILESYYCQLNAKRLFFYYPSEAYVSWLMSRQELHFLQEIDCRDQFSAPTDRERILVFELPDLHGQEVSP